jgi:putative ABC transport system permease protein
MRWKQAFEAVGQDLRVTGRQLRTSRGFTLTVVVTLALAIGAATAVFSIVDGVLLRPLPFAAPDRLVRVFPVSPGGAVDAFSPPNFLDWQAASRRTTAAAAIDGGTLNLSGAGGEPEQVQGARVSASLFSVLGVRPLVGRWFAPEENQRGGPRVAVISEALWRRRFGGDRGVVGRPIELNGQPYTVIGVAPRHQQFPSDVEVWVPLVFSAQALRNRGAYYLAAIARLAPGATLASARAEARAIGHRLTKQYLEDNAGYGLGLAPLQELMVGDVRTPLLVLLGAVLSVLLIACANVASLLLVRAAAREGEVAIRMALGARRERIVRHLLIESLVLALAGGAAGLGLAAWVMEALVALAPPQTPRLNEVGLSLPVLLFALGITLATGMLFGLAPTLQASRPDLAGTMRQETSGSRGHAGARARNVLVVAEVAVAMVLLTCAGLLLRSFARLQKAELGFRPEHALTFSLSLPSVRYADDPQVRAFVDRLLERMERLPGVTAAGAASYAMPLDSRDLSYPFAIEGRPPALPGQKPGIRVGLVTPSFFSALGVPLRRGRGLTERDRAGAQPVVLLNEAAARRFFPAESPLGRRIRLDWTRNGVVRGGEVVGIVGDYRQEALQREPSPQVFLPIAQATQNSVTVVLRTVSDPAAAGGAARAAVREIDAAIPLYELRTLNEVVAVSAAPPKFYMLLLGGFAGIALLLAAVGIYGVIGYTVRKRTQEIGIRMALGATRERVLCMVVRQGLTLAALGAAAGLAGALFATRALRGLLYQVSAADPAIYLAVAALLVLVAALASWLPARHAASTEPQTALRGQG